MSITMTLKHSSTRSSITSNQNSLDVNGSASAAAIHDQSSPRKISNISAVSTKHGELLLQEFLLRKIFAEVIATFLLVFVTCGASALSRNDEHSVSKLAASAAGGLIVTVMIYSVGHISGAHMNPAVTFAFALTRHFPWIQVPLYICAQITGATAAAFTLKAIMVTSLHYHDLGTTTPSAGIYNAFQALTMEIIVTFTLMFVTMSVATDSKAVGELAGLAVGSAVSLASILAGPISGASMNPARTLGPALASNKYKSLWVYFVGPFLGAVMGAWSYTFIRVGNIDDNNNKNLKPIAQRQTSLFNLRPMEISQPQDNDYINQDGNFSIV